MEVPYENKRHGYKHLSITVQEDGQIQHIDEAEAGFRLASIATSSGSAGSSGATARPQPVNAAKPKALRSRAQAGRRSATRARPTHGHVAPSPPRRAWILRMRWLIGATIVIVALLAWKFFALRLKLHR
jgi:hypothetical protein